MGETAFYFTIVFIATLECCFALSAPNIGENHKSATAEVISDDETYLEKFLDDEASKLENRCSISDNLSDQVDTLLSRLNSAIDGSEGERLTNGFRQAIKLDDIIQYAKPSEAPKSNWTLPKGLKRKNKSKLKPPFRFKRDVGLANALLYTDTSDRNPNIIGAKRQVDFDSLTSSVTNEFKRLPISEEETILRVSYELAQLETSGKEFSLTGIIHSNVQPIISIGKAILWATASVAKHGLEILDRYHQSLEFVLQLPVIGAELQKLKELGGSMFHGLSLVRHAYYLLKLSGHVSSPDGTKPAVDDKRLKKAKKMLSEIGTLALKSMVHKLILSVTKLKVREDDTQEIVSRAFYAILSVIISQNTACTVRPSSS